MYPTCDRCKQIYDAAVDRFAKSVRVADEAKLNSIAKWGAGEAPLRSLAVRMVFHAGNHCGQLADLRRAMGMGSIFS